MKLAKENKDIYDKLKNQAWTYKQVAEEVGIDAEKFAHLMRNRFDTPKNEKEGKTFHLSYTLEWAARVQDGWHWDAADEETQKVLKEAGYEGSEK